MEMQKAQSLSSYADVSNNLPPWLVFSTEHYVDRHLLKGTAVLDVTSGLDFFPLVCEYKL